MLVLIREQQLLQPAMVATYSGLEVILPITVHLLIMQEMLM